MTNKYKKAIGLMSGTSMDGIDAAVITTDGVEISEFGEFVTIPYSNEMRDRIRAEIANAKSIEHKAKTLADYQANVKDKNLERDLTLAHAEAVKKLGVKADVAGFHGQTIIHKPELGFSWQMGDGALLASETGMDVVNDFRNSDIKAGGQGAPLVPVYHRAIAEGLPKPTAIVNIGGVGNITYIDANNEIWAFDTGPGNALINDIMKQHYGKEFDEDGKIAASGMVHGNILSEYVNHPYFAKKPPKSLDRNEFDLGLVENLKPEDAVSTLTAFTIETILRSFDYFDGNVERFFVCGGGSHNKTIMTMLGEDALPIEKLGLNADAIEAQAFAYLAVRVLNDLPISFPNTTGCKESPKKNIAPIRRP